MSNPMSSLKKSRKNPLPGIGLQSGRNVPFRSPEYSDDESKLLDEITNKMAEEKLKDIRSSSRLTDPFNGGIPAHVERDGADTPRSTGVKNTPSDKELLGLMMTRLNHLEQRLQYQTKEMSEKDKKIHVLEDKIRIMQKAKDGGGGIGERNTDLEKKCLLLQQQVHEMETFLADYGMMWVGETVDPESNVYNDDDFENVTASPMLDTMWMPEKSTIAWGDFEVDYDLVIRNINELNALAGDGISHIQKTSGGAKLKMQDPVPLILYANGILMYSGPFRPFTDEPTQACLRDLMDGYFPSELQVRYPDGIPISVTDKRNVQFQDKRADVFKGSGQVLGGDTKPSRLVHTNLKDSKFPETKTSSSARYVQDISHENKSTLIADGENGQPYLEVESEIPGPKLTMDQFLHKLPQAVIKQGRVIDIRESVGETLQTFSSSPRNKVILIETKAVKDMKNRLEIPEEKRPPSARDLTTLRIKSENGDQTYVMKMKFNDTIGDIRGYLKVHRPQQSDDYLIMSAFPKKTFTDDLATLKQSGLVPNANLHLKSAVG